MVLVSARCLEIEGISSGLAFLSPVSCCPNALLCFAPLVVAVFGFFTLFLMFDLKTINAFVLLNRLLFLSSLLLLCNLCTLAIVAMPTNTTSWEFILSPPTFLEMRKPAISSTRISRPQITLSFLISYV